MRAVPLAAAALLLPTTVQAQAYRCVVPNQPLRVRPDLPTRDQPKRVLPIGGYTLAVSWSPQFCRERGRGDAARFQCRKPNSFGWTLHGLWPDGVGKDWPQYCRATGIVPQPVIRATMCATPSAQLIQHEWAKHGTCMAGYDPARYFGQATGLYARLRYPDMDALSREPLTAGRLAAAVARVNPGLPADGMRVTVTRDGWLDELWVCLDRRFRYRRCPAHQGGSPAGAAVRIWRGRR